MLRCFGEFCNLLRKNCFNILVENSFCNRGRLPSFTYRVNAQARCLNVRSETYDSEWFISTFGGLSWPIWTTRVIGEGTSACSLSDVHKATACMAYERLTNWHKCCGYQLFINHLVYHTGLWYSLFMSDLSESHLFHVFRVTSSLHDLKPVPDTWSTDLPLDNPPRYSYFPHSPILYSSRSSPLRCLSSLPWTL